MPFAETLRLSLPLFWSITVPLRPETVPPILTLQLPSHRHALHRLRRHKPHDRFRKVITGAAALNRSTRIRLSLWSDIYSGARRCAISLFDLAENNFALAGLALIMNTDGTKKLTPNEYRTRAKALHRAAAVRCRTSPSAFRTQPWVVWKSSLPS